MTRQEQAKLATVVRDAINRSYDLHEGRSTTSHIVEMLLMEHPVLIGEYAESLAKAGLTAMVNGQIKTANKSESEQMQANLFGNREPGLLIPKSIAVPSPDGSREVVWVQTTKATLGEIDQYIKHLNASIRADQAKRSQLEVFRDRVAELTGGDDLDTPISELLSGIRAHSARAV